jgi:hypothetical protein
MRLVANGEARCLMMFSLTKQTTAGWRRWSLAPENIEQRVIRDG